MKAKEPIHIHFTRGDESSQSLEHVPGSSLLDTIRNFFPNALDAPCGGRGTCGKCKVLVSSGDAGPVTREERHLLTHEELQGGIRLACLCRPVKSISVHAIGSGSHTVLDAIGSFSETPEPRISEPGSYGVAIDIGTTTVVGYLISFSPPAEVVGVQSRLNAQRSWGADVISRISFAGEKEENLRKLSSAIREQIEVLIKKLLEERRAGADTLREIVIAGNTTMLHLFAGVDPSSIAVAPFTPVFTEEVIAGAEEYALPFPRAELRLLPSIAGYVGADICAGMAAVGIDRKEGLTLLLDLGTNGEMALGNRDRLLTCATAAGPAFEGAGISYGTGGIPGAIDTVVADDGELRWTSIGGKEPVGICGSGILDTVAALLSLGVVDSTGAMSDKYSEKGYPLFDGSEERGKGNGAIYFTQKDVRQIQLAKGAVAAGVQVLLDEWGCSASEITEVYLAGGFGNYLRPSSALISGLLPRETGERIIPAKNSAGLGAVRALLFKDEPERIRSIAQKSEYIELSTDSRFQEHFMEQMLFPVFLEDS
ncbi:MAG: ASKHA domain-containing protein [Spirochaetaceae bacterium]